MEGRVAFKGYGSGALGVNLCYIWLSGFFVCDRQCVKRLSSAGTQYNYRPWTRIFPHLFTPTLMSSTTTSSTNFQSILDAAFLSYSTQTGIDITKHPSADKLQHCHSPEDVIRVLLERESAFRNFREKYHKLIDFLRPVVKVVHAFSAILAEAAGLVSPRQSTL